MTELRPIRLTYSKTIAFTPTYETFKDWDVEPKQEDFDDMMREAFFDEIEADVNDSNWKGIFSIEWGDTVEFEWEPVRIKGDQK